MLNLRHTHVTLALWSVVCSSAAPSLSAQVTVTYDRFSDQTRVSTGRINLVPTDGQPSSAFQLTALFVCPGKTLCRPNLVALIFSARTESDLQYSRSRSLIFLADGERLNLGDTEYEVVAREGFSLEFLQAYIPAGQVVTLANADSVEGRLGPTEFQLPESGLSELRDLLAKMTPG